MLAHMRVRRSACLMRLACASRGLSSANASDQLLLDYARQKQTPVSLQDFTNMGMCDSHPWTRVLLSGLTCLYITHRLVPV